MRLGVDVVLSCVLNKDYIFEFIIIIIIIYFYFYKFVIIIINQ